MGILKNRLSKFIEVLDPEELAKKGADYLISITPRDSGNAKNNTKAERNEIQANYKYAGKLDSGYSSQNQRGLIRPTKDYLRQYIKKEVR